MRFCTSFQCRLPVSNQMQSRPKHHVSSISTMGCALDVGPRNIAQDLFALNEDVRTLCEQGRLKKAVHCLLLMERHLAHPRAYVHLLNKCSKQKAITEGKQVHHYLIKSGFVINVSVGTSLVRMYTACGSLVDAQMVFESMQGRNRFSWNLMIAAYCKNGRDDKAVKLFWQMLQETVEPDEVTVVNVMKACSSLSNLEVGKKIHRHVLKNGMPLSVYMGNTLIDMYGRCGAPILYMQYFGMYIAVSVQNVWF